MTTSQRLKMHTRTGYLLLLLPPWLLLLLRGGCVGWCLAVALLLLLHLCQKKTHGLEKVIAQVAQSKQGGGEELPYSDSTFGRIRCPIFAD
jgi:hypothetical protein